ncbi:lytic murein transglycosylase [Pseudorhodoferax sp.]|uniref:lytic murein transglycosylase n=1 Tax=Pseudorhodoferax sp. TaxID=1993553 RepID=UPI002DD65A60|nr:lytic murein transglycosylase [Pseudorhodoferax sp.]
MPASTMSPRRRLLAPLVAALALAGCAAPPPAPTASTPPPVPAPAPAARPAPAPTQDFAQWIAQFQDEARRAGIDEATLHAAFDGVQHLDQVVALDRAQPEFTRSVWDYLDTAVSPQRVVRGQDKLLEVRAPVDAAAARYGVPAEIVVAIWGMESNYGSNYGDTPTIDALATLGFEGRRAAWARTQLLAALRILQRGDIPRERMLGSWAGAMGQTQFLPSNFLAYAVDADGDGRRDIWGSMADVTASTAHFLAREGWQRGQPWGLEVRLPPDFDLGRADDTLRQHSTQWATEGVRAADGAPLPELPDASLLLPAGARGPAFLVGPNFRAILRYNNATSYALAVGLLAQRIAGGPALQAAWPRELKPLSRNELQALQQALQARGFDSGAIDGVLGPATRSAIRRWQRSAGLAADGYPTHALLEQLQKSPPP